MKDCASSWVTVKLIEIPASEDRGCQNRNYERKQKQDNLFSYHLIFRAFRCMIWLKQFAQQHTMLNFQRFIFVGVGGWPALTEPESVLSPTIWNVTTVAVVQNSSMNETLRPENKTMTIKSLDHFWVQHGSKSVYQWASETRIQTSLWGVRQG